MIDSLLYQYHMATWTLGYHSHIFYDLTPPNFFCSVQFIFHYWTSLKLHISSYLVGFKVGQEYLKILEKKGEVQNIEENLE